jgi:prefoldin subunit 5
MSDERTGESDEPFNTERTSDAPVDLAREREAFVRTFLRKGVELTEGLLAENQELQAQIARLQAENARMRAQIASDDAIRELLRTVERLEREKEELLSRADELERRRSSHEGRSAEIEQELNDLANLYVASFQLHASLVPRRVLRHVKELLGQLIGARAFVIYALDPGGRTVSPVGWEGIAETELGPIEVGAGKIGEACATGLTAVRDDGPLGEGGLGDPLAVVPLLVEGRPVGAIAVLSLLEQKQGWATVDTELFHLLGAHAAPALVAASLYGRAPQVEAALASLREQLSAG